MSGKWSVSGILPRQQHNPALIHPDDHGDVLRFMTLTNFNGLLMIFDSTFFGYLTYLADTREDDVVTG